jgi:superfamily II DNA or RNA helicase
VRIWDNQNHRCGVEPYDEQVLDRSQPAVFGCGERVRNRDGEFHIHHVSPHALGGPTTIDNAIGLCARCHRRVDHSALEGPDELPPLWPWQEEAITEAVRILSAPGTPFTAAAAPAAGKTRMATVLGKRLMEAETISRVVVIVPTGQLCTQWADDMADDVGIWLDPTVTSQPFNIRAGYDGVSVTWASLTKAQTVRDHIELANEQATLFIFDEVHHAADHASWGTAAKAFVKQIPSARFLNLSGTLFRSRPGETIATVRYEPDPSGLLVAQAEVNIPASQLIKDGTLRHLELYQFDSEVRGVDLESGEIHDTSLGIAGDDSRITAALRTDDAWLTAFFEKWTAHLASQRRTYDNYPFKGLVVAATQALADRYHQILSEMLLGHEVWLAKSADGPAAKVALESARKSRKPGVLVAIAMASEGYNNPDLSSIAYLSDVSASLRLAQIAGRVMRPTKREKATKRNIGGTVWLPSTPEMVDKWRDVLRNDLHVVDPEDMTCVRCGRPKPCGCPPQTRICSRCGLPKPCKCPPGEFTPAEQTFDFSDPTLSGVHVDGDEVALDGFTRLVTLLQNNGHANLVPAAAQIMHAFEQAGVTDVEQIFEVILRRK